MPSSGQTSVSDRLNLHFDELDRDILDWLNSFGKGKRARVAKAALRRVMSEGVSIPELLNASESCRWFPPSDIASPRGGEAVTVGETSDTVPTIEADDVFGLLELTGTESDPEVLELLKGKR
ncbi:hypothetical protein CEB3_c17850 [Peptococcaceae bacterium CEB3]|nr:hypothetical protein CEB3_c17850 [Peptococcaceae bacterium CEB3]